jgi:predicted nucleotidyltransferase
VSLSRPQSHTTADKLINRLVSLIEGSARYGAIIAVELGGSRSRGEDDELSDIDLFAYVEKCRLEQFIERDAVSLIKEVGNVTVIKGPDYKPGFGWGYSIYYEYLGLVSLLIRSDKEVRPNYMRKVASVVYDRDGQVSVALKRSTRLPVPKAELARQALATCYIRLLQTAKEWARGNYWQARKYYRDVLEHVLVLARLVTGQEPRGRDYRNCGRGMERNLPSLIASRIGTLDIRATTDGISPSLVWDTVMLVVEFHDQLTEEADPLDWKALARRVLAVLEKTQ